MKIKLTESQVLMLQHMDTKKVVRITEDQFNRILSPQNIDLLTFAKGIIEFLKEIMINPENAGMTPLWNQMGTNRNELYKIMGSIGMVKVINVEGKKQIKIVKKNLKRNIKRLYDIITTKQIKHSPEPVEEYNDNLPMGAEHDPRAPYNDNTQYTKRKPTNDIYKVIYYNKEIAILSHDNSLYAFYYYHIPKNDFVEYSEVPYEYNGEDHEYGDFEIDGDTLQGYINDNISKLVKGVGIESYENGDDITKIDKEVANSLLSTWNSEKLAGILGHIEETTSAGSSGAFVGPFMGEPEKIDEEDVPLQGDPIQLEDNEKPYNQDEYHFYVVDRKRRKIYGGNHFEEGAKIYLNALAEAHHDKKLAVYTLQFLKDNDLDPNDNKNWITKSEIDENTTTASSGSYVQPKIWAKSKKDHKFNSKPMYNGGQIVGGATEDAIEGINETEATYPGGKFIKIDKCAGLNNIDNSSDCSVGDSGVVSYTDKSSDKIY